MTFPDACPNCGAIPKVYQERSYVRIYECRTWIIETPTAKGTQKTKTCDDWRTIKDATTVICAFLDADPEARQMGQDWLAGNIP